MSKNRAWTAPGWPWELELLTLLFVALAIGVPYYIFHTAPVPVGRTAAEAALATQHGLLWSVAVIALYVAHYIFASSSIETISTPFSHLVSPTLFAGVAYYRIIESAKQTGTSIDFVTGAPWQVIVGLLLIILFTLLIARIRMARHLLDYRDVKWDINAPATYDNSFMSLWSHFHPLLYPPRIYRACDRGILVEGWYYVRSIPFNEVQSMSPVNSASSSSAGYFLASSARNLLRLELSDSTIPLYISPSNRDDMMRYAAHYVARRQKSTHGGTGTTSGKTRAGAGRT